MVLALRHPFRHSGWASTRQRVYAAMIATNQSHTRLRAFSTCGSDWIVYVRPEGYDAPTYRLAPLLCHDRLCRPCANYRSLIVSHNCRALLPHEPLRFLTLTLAHTDDPLPTQLNRLVRSFRRLRTSPLWKDRVTGGVAFLEITPARDALHWHPHLHVLIRGRYLPQPLLSKQWLHVTGDSTIVDIRRIDDHAAATAYVTKYASKPIPQLATHDPELLCQLVNAIRNRRLIIPFGNCRHWRLTRQPPGDGWEYLGTLSGYQDRALAGNTWAQQLVTAALDIGLRSPTFTVQPNPPAP